MYRHWTTTATADAVAAGEIAEAAAIWPSGATTTLTAQELAAVTAAGATAYPLGSVQYATPFGEGPGAATRYLYTTPTGSSLTAGTAAYLHQHAVLQQQTHHQQQQHSRVQHQQQRQLVAAAQQQHQQIQLANQQAAVLQQLNLSNTGQQSSPPSRPEGKSMQDVIEIDDSDDEEASVHPPPAKRDNEVEVQSRKDTETELQKKPPPFIQVDKTSPSSFSKGGQSMSSEKKNAALSKSPLSSHQSRTNQSKFASTTRNSSRISVVTSPNSQSNMKLPAESNNQVSAISKASSSNIRPVGASINSLSTTSTKPSKVAPMASSKQPARVPGRKRGRPRKLRQGENRTASPSPTTIAIVPQTESVKAERDDGTGSTNNKRLKTSQPAIVVIQNWSREALIEESIKNEKELKGSVLRSILKRTTRSKGALDPSTQNSNAGEPSCITLSMFEVQELVEELVKDQQKAMTEAVDAAFAKCAWSVEDVRRRYADDADAKVIVLDESTATTKSTTPASSSTAKTAAATLGTSGTAAPNPSSNTPSVLGPVSSGTNSTKLPQPLELNVLENRDVAAAMSSVAAEEVLRAGSVIRSKADIGDGSKTEDLIATVQKSLQKHIDTVKLQKEEILKLREDIAKLLESKKHMIETFQKEKGCLKDQVARSKAIHSRSLRAYMKASVTTLRWIRENVEGDESDDEAYDSEEEEEQTLE